VLNLFLVKKEKNHGSLIAALALVSCAPKTLNQSEYYTITITVDKHSKV